jgi:hypothetical protein
MGRYIVLGFTIFFAFAALGQTTATVVSGYASNWAPQAVYAVPYVPLVTTPSVQLGAPPLTIGASDSTAGMATGASNSTLMVETPIVSSVFARPVWYGTVTAGEAPEASAPAPQPRSRYFDYVASGPENSGSVFQGAAAARGHQRANRTYTNDDVNRVIQKTGVVQHGGKTEKF